MYNVSDLQGEQAARYGEFTFPKYRPLLQEIGARKDVIAVGGCLLGRPIGLALARIHEEPQEGELLSVAVAAEYRRAGVGASLLARLEEELAARQCHRAEGRYLNSMSSSAALEGLFQKCQWELPRRRALVCRTDVSTASKAPWVHRFPHGKLAFFPWSDLTFAERREIIRHGEGEEALYPPGLSPFAEEDRIQWECSVGLRWRGEVVGWMITHRVLPDTLRYSRLFLRADLRNRGWAIALLAESIRRHLNSPVACQAVYGIWDVALDNEPMLRFVRRHLAPFLLSTCYTMGVSKNLANGEQV